MLDIHCHTRFSHDGKDNIEKYIHTAIEKGFTHLGFSEHADFEYIEFPDFASPMSDFESYKAEFFPLKKKYSNKIKLLFGAEFGFCLAEDFLKDFAMSMRFDYIINSVHIPNGIDCYYKEYYNDRNGNLRSKKDAYTEYLNRVCMSIDATYPFQIIGHIGYIERYAPYENAELTFDEFGDIIDEILNKIIKRGVAVEINTKHPKGKIFPNIKILQRYYDLGGRKISFGSDSHSAELLATNYDGVVNIAKEIGFDGFCIYEKMQEKKIVF